MPPDALPVQRDAVVGDSVGHEHALDVVTKLRQHRADRSAVLGRDRVVRVRPHEPVAGGKIKGSVAGCGEVVNVRPVVDVEILVNDAVAFSRNVERLVRLLIADCPHHNDLVGEILEMIEEAVDVVFGVAGDDAKAQFVFHISSGDVMRGEVGGKGIIPSG